MNPITIAALDPADRKRIDQIITFWKSDFDRLLETLLRADDPNDAVLSIACLCVRWLINRGVAFERIGDFLGMIAVLELLGEPDAGSDNPPVSG